MTIYRSVFRTFFFSLFILAFIMRTEFVNNLSKDTVIEFCESEGLEATGSAKELRARFYKHMVAHPEFIPTGYLEFQKKIKEAKLDLKKLQVVQGTDGRPTTPQPNSDIESYFREESEGVVEVPTEESVLDNLHVNPVEQGVQNNMHTSSTEQDAHTFSDFVDDLKSALLGAIRGSGPSHVSRRDQFDSTSSKLSKAKQIRLFLQEAKSRGIIFRGTGKEDVKELFKKLKNLRKLFPIEDDDLADVFQELCTGAALRYCKTHPKECETLRSIAHNFITVFSPYTSQTQLKSDLYQRTQVSNERIDHYISIIKTMNEKLLHPLYDDELFEIIRDNLHGDYIQMIRNVRVRDLEQLAEVCREGEKLLDRERKYQPPPSRLLRQYVDPEESPQRRVAFENRDSSPHHNTVRSSAVTSTADKSKPSYRSNNSRNSPDAREKSNQSDKHRKHLICWNCREPGHTYYTCLDDRKLFCYNCGNPGVHTVKCSCQKERHLRNRSPTPTSRGFRSRSTSAENSSA